MDGASGGLCRGGGLAWRAAGPGAVEVGAGGAGGAARLELPEGPGAPARVAAAGLLGGGAAVAAARGGALRVWERAEGGAAADFEVPGGAGAVLAVGATATGVIVMLGLESGELARVDVGTSQGALSPRVLPRGKPRVSGGGSGGGGSMLTPLKRLSSMVVETLHSRPGGGLGLRDRGSGLDPGVGGPSRPRSRSAEGHERRAVACGYGGGGGGAACLGA